MRTYGFRGLIASASLKLGNAFGSEVNAKGIPRLDCLGLIEARRYEFQQIPTARFRGLIASASLKPDPADVADADKDKIPRLDCLGLIEAAL